MQFGKGHISPSLHMLPKVSVGYGLRYTALDVSHLVFRCSSLSFSSV